MTDWRVPAAAWWSSPDWHAYEALHDGPPGTRARLLASATWQTRVIDLEPSVPGLWAGVRKSYHSLIHRAEERDHFAPCSAAEFPVDCREVHRLASGHVTRSQETWDLMGEWIKTGTAMAMCAWPSDPYDSRPSAYALWIGAQDWRYYASGASLEDDLQHAVIWHSLIELKARGVRCAELGWQGEATTEKGRGIEKFKAGFGGVDVDARL